MSTPPIALVAGFTPFLAVASGLATRAHRDPGARLVLWWCAASAAMNAVQAVPPRVPNLWLSYPISALEIALLVPGLLLLIPVRTINRWIWGMLLAALALVIALTVMVESLATWPLFAGTLRSLIVGSAAAAVLLLRTVSSGQSYWRDGPRIIATGVLLYVALEVPMQLASRPYVLASDREALMQLFVARSWAMSAAYATVAYGLAWISRTPPSGSAFSPLPSSPSAA